MKFVITINLSPSHSTLYYGGVSRTLYCDSKDKDALYEHHHLYTVSPNLAVTYNTFEDACKDALTINDEADYNKAHVVRLDNDELGDAR